MAGHRRVAKKSPQKGPSNAGLMGNSAYGRVPIPESQEVCAAVVAAVQSLYDDGLKPLGRILRKRLGERSQAGSEGLDLSIERLHAVCKACGELIVESAEGGDWTALIAGRPQTFVDVCSPVDIYPESMWKEAAEYFESLGGDEAVLPGGRYSCAEELSSRGVAFLKPYSLGQICHIVQLSISQKKLLGYCSGAVVPYARSQSMVKDQCAVLQQPCTSPTTGSVMPLADWTTARRCLQEILDNSTCPAPGVVPLSNVKRLFRSMYHIELSETILGHSKVSELLQDPRFGDICTVQLQGHGYIVVRNPPLSPATTAASSPKKGSNRNEWNRTDVKGGMSPLSQRSPSPNRQIRSPVPPGLLPSSLEDAALMMNLPTPLGMNPLGMDWPSPMSPYPQEEEDPYLPQRLEVGEDGTVIRSPNRSPSPGKRRSAAYAAANLAAAQGMIQASGLEPLEYQDFPRGMTPAEYASPARSQSPKKKNSAAKNMKTDEEVHTRERYGTGEDGSTCSSNGGSTTASLEGGAELVSPSMRSSMIGSTPLDQPMKVWLSDPLQGSPAMGVSAESAELQMALDEAGAAGLLPPGLPVSENSHLVELLSPTRAKRQHFASSSMDPVECESETPAEGQTLLYAAGSLPRGPLSPQRSRPQVQTGTGFDMKRPGNLEAGSQWSRDGILSAGPLSPLHQPRTSSGMRGGEFSWSPSRRGPGRVPPQLETGGLLAQKLTEEELQAALLNPAMQCTLRLSELV